MRAGRQTSKVGNTQKKVNANMSNEMELTENERRVTLTLHVKPRLMENQTGKSEDKNTLPSLEQQQQEQHHDNDDDDDESDDKLAPLSIKTSMIDAKNEQEFPVFTYQINSTSRSVFGKLANTSTPHKSSARRLVSQTPKRHDVSNKENVNAEMPDDISLQLWSWQEVINITSLRHLCDDKYRNVVEIVQRVTACPEFTETLGIPCEVTLTSNSTVNTSSAGQSNDKSMISSTWQCNQESGKTTNTEKSKATVQIDASKNVQQQQQQQQHEEKQEEEEEQKLQAQKQKSNKQKNANAKLIKRDKQVTSKNGNKTASTNVSAASSTINNLPSKHEPEKVEKIDMVVAKIQMHLCDLLHQTMTKYTIKLESKHANWIEECWLELKCERLPLLTEELIKLYRPVMVTIELCDFYAMFSRDKVYDESKSKQSTRRMTCERQHNMWLRLSAFDQVKSHHIMVKSECHKFEKENNINIPISTNKTSHNCDLMEQQWQTVFFLGDMPMLHVYQLLFFDKMTIELYESEAVHNDTNIAMHIFRVNESTLVGSARISLKEYLMLNHTLHEETVQLLPSERASHALSEYNMTSAATLGIAVNFYLPFPPIAHVRDDNTISNNDDGKRIECTDEFLTRGVVIMPYADEWVGNVIKTLIEEVKKRPAVHDRNNGELYLYIPENVYTNEIETTSSTTTTKNVNNDSVTISPTSNTNVNARLTQHLERQQDHRQDGEHTNARENELEKKMKNAKKKQQEQQSQQLQHVASTIKEVNKDNKNNNVAVSCNSKANKCNSRVSNEKEPMVFTETETIIFTLPFQIVTPAMISGFEVMDGCYRVICIEGPMKDVQLILEAAAVSANNHPALRVLFNSELFIPHREYGTFPPLVTLPVSSLTDLDEHATHEPNINNTNAIENSTLDLEHSDAEAGGTGGRIHRVRLSESISSICNHEKYWLHRILSNSCAECIRKLSALMSSQSCTTMREAVDNNLLPSSVEIIALERAFGQTLSTTDLYSVNNNNNIINNSNNFEAISKGADNLTLQQKHISEAEYLTEQSVNNNTKVLQNKVEKGLEQELQECQTELCSSDIGKIVSFRGMIDSTKTRLAHKLLPASLRARYRHICYMNIIDDANSESKSVKDSLSIEEQRTRSKSRVISLQPKIQNSFLCGFLRHTPAPSIAYRVDGQIVSYDSHVLLHVLSLECITAKLTKTQNTSYDKLLRQRHHEECYRTSRHLTTTATMKHLGEGKEPDVMPAAKQTENIFSECRISATRKTKQGNDVNEKVDDEDNDVWLEDRSWEFEEQVRQKEFIREMQKKEEQRHTARPTQQSIKLAQLHKQPTLAEKAAEYALCWKLYNARAPTTEIPLAKHAVMRFEK